MTALIVALLMPFGLVPGLIGGMLGRHELSRIKRGESPKSGEGYARLALWLGVVAVVGLLALIAWTIDEYYKPVKHY
ncbi:MAG: hypothetical protein JST54_00540 [Deltaproteobacteria bacterium]|nr:hypothetical protein [Deltaproteobacteria bacterium]